MGDREVAGASVAPNGPQGWQGRETFLYFIPARYLGGIAQR